MAQAAPARTPIASHGRAAGTIVAINSSSFTIQTSARRMSVLEAITAAANAMTDQNYPYVWGGGHAEAGVPSIGERGPGYNGHRIGYDCSGTVSSVLASSGLWPVASGVPGDAGVITQLRQARLIGSGPGTGRNEVTLYDDPGVHVYMNIDDQFFGTGANGAGGPGWLGQGSPGVAHRFKRFHILRSVLSRSTTYGQDLTFQGSAVPRLMSGMSTGERIRVAYAKTKSGLLKPTSVTSG